MFSHKVSILQLTCLLHQHGIHDIVLCPGSRNAPICHTLCQSGLFHCHPITDERSAGFYAIGIALATHNPVAVCVTSGSALANLHPAVCEAFYQQVPLIILSADRPTAWIGQMDGQTFPQPHIFGQMAKSSVTLPECHNATEQWHCNRLINEALLECTHHTLGPIHINVPIAEPLYEFTTEQLPKVRAIHRCTMSDEKTLLLHQKDCHNAIIIIGQMPANSIETSLFVPSRKHRFRIIAETLSNISHTYLDANPSEINWSKMRPLDLVITIGGHLIHKNMKEWLRTNPPREHWHVSPDGVISDIFCCQTLCIESTPQTFFKEMPYKEMEDMELPLLPPSPTPSVVARLIKQLPSHAILHLANSSTVRFAQQHIINPTVTVCCNRGINGIEGCMSSAVGYASATPDRPNFLIIGDLSFFYDQNALWNTNLPDNLHILLLNNGGGGIFNTLPIPSDEQSQHIIRATHHTSAKDVCKQYGLQYLTKEDRLIDFINCPSSVILEIML